MNFLTAAVAEGGRAAVLPGGQRLAVDAPGLAALPGRTVTIGLRPEHLELAGGGGEGMRLIVDHVELLGADTLVYGHFGSDGAAVTVRLSGVRHLEKNTVLPLTIAPGKLHLFDPETKKRIEA
jgi:ABC-type sugar transport system ATPase subunit